MSMILGVDIGGTKTLLGAFNDSGKLSRKVRFKTPKSYGGFLEEFASAFRSLGEQNFKLAVVAAPGLLDRDHGIGIAFGNLSWKNVPLQKDINGIIRCKTFIENDSKLAALSETKDWRAEKKKVLYVTISTGISGGVVENGYLDESFIDSELGQILVPDGNQLKTWEEVSSGKAIVKKYGSLASDINDPKIWQEISKGFSLGFRDLCAVIQPEMIIIGGGVGSHFNKFGRFLVKDVKAGLPPLVPMPEFVGAKDAEMASLKGCYVYAKQKLA